MSSRGCRAKRRLFKKEAHSSCRSLRSTLVKMKRNLKSLERKASRLSGGGSSSKRTKRRIQRAMKRHRCNAPDVRTAKGKRTNILEQIFGKSEAKKRREQARKDRVALRKERRNAKKKRVVSTEERLKNYNTVRTVCVRTCDGHHFPVSFSTKKSELTTDAQACSNLCPGVDMELFYHKTGKESIEQMISTVDGRPYTSLPNAFAYRERYNAGCSCNYRLLTREAAAQPQETLTAKQELERDRTMIGRIAAPAWRLDPGQDPETIANHNGGIDLTKFRDLDANDGNEEVAANRKIRVIGEEFLPDQ